jgi:pimeloyl-ACP methyl ester carboxylesterase
VRVLLIPGFWLDASSWDDVLPALAAAGHQATALTLPGLESRDADRRGITLRDHVDAVVAAVDAGSPADDPVVLVGHSGGGGVAQAVADARPDRIAHVVYVDSLPLRDGGCINDELPVVDGEVPLPDWSFFDDADLVDLDERLRASFRARAIPMPASVASDPQRLHDPRRYDVPVTVIACEFTDEQLRGWMSEDSPWTSELAAIRDVSIVDLPTGHWPQFTRPHDLAAAITAAIGDDR